MKRFAGLCLLMLLVVVASSIVSAAAITPQANTQTLMVAATQSPPLVTMANVQAINSPSITANTVLQAQSNNSGQQEHDVGSAMAAKQDQLTDARMKMKRTWRQAQITA